VAESTFRTFLYTITDAIKLAFAPITSLWHTAISKKDSHHHQADIKKTSTPEEITKYYAMQDSKAKAGSRNIYLTDLDDTIIDWKPTERSKFEKRIHKTIYRPADEKIECFEGFKEHMDALNSGNVRTAIVSNKDHEKLLAQAKHHKWELLFDKIIGHDRFNAFYTRKSWFNGWYNLPALATERLIGKLHKDMEPVNVIFVGDRPDQDIAAANALDKQLKKLNPRSSCTSILLNSRKFTKEKLDNLSIDQRPTHIVDNYSQIKEITDAKFGLTAKAKTIVAERTTEQVNVASGITTNKEARMTSPLPNIPTKSFKAPEFNKPVENLHSPPGLLNGGKSF